MLVRRSGGKRAKSFFYISALALVVYGGYYLMVLSEERQIDYRPRYNADHKIHLEIPVDSKKHPEDIHANRVVQTRIHFQKPAPDNQVKNDVKSILSVEPFQTEPTNHPVLKPIDSTKKARNQLPELGIKNADFEKVAKSSEIEPPDHLIVKSMESTKKPETKAGIKLPELVVKDTLNPEPTEHLVQKPIEPMKKPEINSKSESPLNIRDIQMNVKKVPPMQHGPPIVIKGKMQSNMKQMPRIPPHAPRRYLRDGKAFERYMEYLNKKEPSLPMQNKAVIILTNHRSGSSFFGELFNQHPDAFYMFEPLLPLGNSWECQINSEWKIEVLKKLVQCELPNWPELYRKIPVKNHVKHTNGNLRQCILKKMCFRMNTYEVCQNEHCPRSANTTIKNCITDCGIVNPEKVNNHCRRKELVALKLIRLCDILDLENIVKNISTDIKVLHLIRDPRGIANSRLHILRGVNIKESIHGTCKRQSHNMMSALVNTSEWLKGRYMVVRYEDAALYPYETAESVYKFVGLSFPDEMKQWISKNTNIEIPTGVLSTAEYPTIEEETHSTLQEQHRAKRSVDMVAASKKEYEKRMAMAKLKKKPGVNPYGTKRNSTATVQKWAMNLPYNTVKTIERECVNIMKIAGYIPIGTLEQYNIKKGIKYFKDEVDFLKNET